MVDKIPWDTRVITLIFGVLKRSVKKALLSVLKYVASFPAPLHLQYNVETLEK